MEDETKWELAFNTLKYIHAREVQSLRNTIRVLLRTK